MTDQSHWLLPEILLRPPAQDDFAGFRGVSRFKKNVSNLGGLTEDVVVKITSWNEGEKSLKAGWRFSAIVGVPWRPRFEPPCTAPDGDNAHVSSAGAPA